MDIKYEDLVAECAKCEGTGVYREGDHRNYTERHCHNCDGKGYTLTPTGDALERFIRRVRPHAR